MGVRVARWTTAGRNENEEAQTKCMVELRCRSEKRVYNVWHGSELLTRAHNTSKHTNVDYSKF